MPAFPFPMPQRAKKPCAAPGCANLVDRGRYCERCLNVGRQARVDLDAARGTSTQRGYDWQWRKYRNAYLRRFPLCRDPYRRHNGMPVEATVVDHITPHRGDRRLFWDPHNHQPLCATCHNFKTATEDSTFARKNGEKQ